jgi:hypothetical protein
MVAIELKLWWFSSRMVMSLEDCAGAADLQLCDVAAQLTGDGGADVEDLVALLVQVAALGSCQHLHLGDQDVEGPEEGDGRVEFDFHSNEEWLWGYEWEVRFF